MQSTCHRICSPACANVSKLTTSGCILCRLLRGDERNFQAWAYWRALTKKMGLPPEELRDYATSKIEVQP